MNHHKINLKKQSIINNPPPLTSFVCLFTSLYFVPSVHSTNFVAMPKMPTIHIQKIVPSMCIIYILGALIICALNISEVPNIIALIINDAFTGMAVAGGSVGTVIIWGVRRAVFSNEAGLGSASIAHAAVKTNYPIREGLVASLGPMIDTIIVCTATAIVIVLSGQYLKTNYSPQSNIISFQNFTIPESKSNWSVQSSNNTQRLTHATNKNNIDSIQTPLLTIVESSTTWYGSPIKQVKGDGIQFSTKRGNGNYAVILRDKNGNRISGFKLDGDEKLFLVSDVKKNNLLIINMQLTTHPIENDWQHHLW